MVLVIGIKSLAPIIDEVKPNSIAAHEGFNGQEEIVSLDDVPIKSWRDFEYQLIPYIGSDHTFKTTVKSLRDGHVSTHSLTILANQTNANNPDILKTLGIIPFIPTVDPTIGEVVNPSPAWQAGLRKGDKITQINEEKITTG